MIIGICGRIGSGKSTTGEIVQEFYPGMNWQVKGFADKLRQVAHIFTGIPPLSMTDQDVKNQPLGDEWGGITLRTFLQRLGTDAIRDNLDESAWVNALMVNYKDVGPYKWNPGSYANICLECTKNFYNGAKLQRVCEDCCKTVGAKFPNWLITDCRFPNELDAIQSRGGTCIRIVRPDNPYPQSNHESETALDGVELLTIINDGSLEQLRLRVKEVFDPIVKKISANNGLY